MPFSAWDMETTPPTRLVVGHFENNVVGGLVDGRYWPGDASTGDNTVAREFCFIFSAPYSTTPDPAFQTNLSGNASLPMMWVMTCLRRNVAPWPGGDEFLITANHVNTPSDTFTFNTTANPQFSKTLAKSRLNKNYIKVVPNPYYGFSAYDLNQFNRRVKITGLPEQCTIRIFNVAGDLIRKIVHNASSNNARSSTAGAYTSVEVWDLTSDNGIFVSSGVYFIHINAPGIGQSEELIPFAIIQGSVQLTVPTN